MHRPADVPTYEPDLYSTQRIDASICCVGGATFDVRGPCAAAL